MSRFPVHIRNFPSLVRSVLLAVTVVVMIAVFFKGDIFSSSVSGAESSTTSVFLPLINKQLNNNNPIGKITASVETDPVPSDGDAADDPAIWVHPTDPSLSLIIGTDKKGGLAVYDLTGKQIQYLPDGRMNNVDLRYDFSLSGKPVDLVTTGNRSADTIVAYRVNPQTRNLENVSGQGFKVGISVYGSCMYHSPVNGKYYVYVDSQSGKVEQWELIDNSSGGVEGELVRTFEVGSQTEGCVADDDTGDFYIGEENVGVWKYGAEPGDGDSRSKIDSTGSGGHLTADVEGLTIYYASGETGYLIASSQGSNEFVVYERQGNHKYIMTFKVAAGNGIDAVSETDGIDVTNFSLGPIFPHGLFVAQDGRNDDGNQNYKLVSWEAIANSVDPPLVIDTSENPRLIGVETGSVAARKIGYTRFRFRKR
jgi:3-phytase